MQRRSRSIALAAVAALAVAAVGPASGAGAASTPSSYLKYGISAKNVPVVGLPGSKSYPSASVLVPKAWKVVARGAGTIRFRTDKASCPYLVTFRTRFVLADTATASAHVTAARPAAKAYVDEQGTRRAVAWRVVRAASTQRLEGLQASVSAIKFAGVPAGKSVFAELVASAPKVNPAKACHSGFYREVARQIGDALATNVRAFG